MVTLFSRSDKRFMGECHGELVSCFMATRNRPGFFRQAVRCFQRQTYRDAELVVVDDGDESVEGLCAGVERVRYLRLNQPTPTGSKLNLAIQHASGGILQKLDDDDYYHPDFLSLAVSHLPQRDRERTLVAWDCFLVWLAGTGRLLHSGHGWTAGGTFCFGRELWERARFRDVPFDEDFFFLEDHQPAVVRVCSPEHYVLVRHGGNTWTRMANGDRADDYLGRLSVCRQPIESLIEAEALEFYRTLPRPRLENQST